MRVDIADWYFINMHFGDIRNYIRSSGDMDQAVIHHLTYDAGCIDPLWGKESFFKRTGKMKELSIKYVVAPDFSSWADFPLAVQIHNYYRSMVVAADLVLAGFKVIPNVCWSAPQLRDLSIRMWPANCVTYLIDASHIHTQKADINAELFYGAADVLKDWLNNSTARILMWAASQRPVNWWKIYVQAGEPVWVPNRSTILNRLVKTLGVEPTILTLK